LSNQYFTSLYCRKGLHLMVGYNRRISIGGHVSCRQCYNEAAKKWRNDNILKVRVKDSRITKSRVERYWQMILEVFGRRCSCCGEEREDFLTLHHVNSDGGEHRKKRRSAKCYFLDVIREGFPTDKYAILCMNCNYAQRWGRTCPHELERRAAVAAD
jgi:hypothetical protein